MGSKFLNISETSFVMINSFCYTNRRMLHSTSVILIPKILHVYYMVQGSGFNNVLSSKKGVTILDIKGVGTVKVRQIAITFWKYHIMKVLFWKKSTKLYHVNSSPGHFSPHFRQGAPAPASCPSFAFNRFSLFASNSFNQLGVSVTSISLLMFHKYIQMKTK